MVRSNSTSIRTWRGAPSATVNNCLSDDTVRCGTSASVSVTSAFVTVKSVALPVTSIVSSPSARLSFVGVSVNVPVPRADSFGIVTAKSETAA